MPAKRSITLATSGVFYIAPSHQANDLAKIEGDFAWNFSGAKDTIPQFEIRSLTWITGHILPNILGLEISLCVDK